MSFKVCKGVGRGFGLLFWREGDDNLCLEWGSVYLGAWNDNKKVDRHEFAFLLSEREKNVNERPCAQNENDRPDRMRKG